MNHDGNITKEEYPPVTEASKGVFWPTPSVKEEPLKELLCYFSRTGLNFCVRGPQVQCWAWTLEIRDRQNIFFCFENSLWPWWLFVYFLHSQSTREGHRQSDEHSNCFRTVCCCWCWSLLYSAILRSRADSLRSHVILHEWTAFYSAFFVYIHRSGVLTALVWLVPHQTVAMSAYKIIGLNVMCAKISVKKRGSLNRAYFRETFGQSSTDRTWLSWKYYLRFGRKQPTRLVCCNPVGCLSDS